MAIATFSVPVDIPWRRIAFSRDMMDKIACESYLPGGTLLSLCSNTSHLRISSRLMTRFTSQASRILVDLRKRHRAVLRLLLVAFLGAPVFSTISCGASRASDWMFIGPAPSVDNEAVSNGYIENTSGRITGIAAHPTGVGTIYVAAAGGGCGKRLTGVRPGLP